MNRSKLKQMTTWLCLLSFGMHVVLHVGPAFHWGIGHSGHGDDHHSLVSYGLSDRPINDYSELDTIFDTADFLESSNHNHHTPVDHSPNPEDHDPTHHLTIQCRTTSQTSSVPFPALFQHRFLSEFASTTTQPSIACTGRDVAAHFNPYVKCVRLIL